MPRPSSAWAGSDALNQPRRFGCLRSSVIKGIVKRVEMREVLISSQSGFKEVASNMESIRPPKLLALVSFACLVSAVVGAVTGITVVHFMGAKPQNVVTTRRLEIVDSSGRTRALLSTNDRGEVSMNFTAVSGNPSLSVGVLRRSDEEMKHPCRGTGPAGVGSIPADAGSIRPSVS